MAGAGERAAAAGVGDGHVDDVQSHTTPLQTQQHHQHRYKTPPRSRVSMRTTFCKYLDRSSRLLPLLNPPFVLGPVRPGPSASLTSPSFKLRIHQSTPTRSHHPVVQARPPETREKLYYCLPPSLSLIYNCHTTWTISCSHLYCIYTVLRPSVALRLLRVDSAP